MTGENVECILVLATTYLASCGVCLVPLEQETVSWTFPPERF